MPKSIDAKLNPAQPAISFDAPAPGRPNRRPHAAPARSRTASESAAAPDLLQHPAPGARAGLQTRPTPHEPHSGPRVAQTMQRFQAGVARAQREGSVVLSHAMQHASQGLAQLRTLTRYAMSLENWSQTARLGGYTAAACCLSLSVGLLSAWLVTPFFLSLAPPAGVTTTMFSQVPFLGPVLTGLVQRGAPLGSLATGLVLWCSQMAMAAAGTLAERRLNWFLCASAIGFAISPLFVPGVAVTGALAAASLLGVGIMAHMTSQRLMPNSPATWQWCLMAVCISVALAPMGAQAALGVPASVILGEAMGIPVVGFLAIALQSMYARFRVLMRALPNNTQNRLGSLHLDRPGCPNPNVFGSRAVPKLTQYIDACVADMQADQSLGLRFLLIRGESGTGKSSMALAELKRLDAHMEMPTLLKLRSGGRPDVALSELFEQALERQRTEGRATVIFVPHCEEFFPLKDKSDAQMNSFVTAAQKYLAAHPDDDSYNLLFVGTTNDEDLIKGAIRSRITERVDVPKPDASALKAIFQQRLAAALEHSFFAPLIPALDVTPSWKLPARMLSVMASEARDAGLVGREIAMYGENLAQCVKESYVQARETLPRRDDGKDSVVTDFDGDLQLAADHRRLWPQYLKDVRARLKTRAQTAHLEQHTAEAGPSHHGQHDAPVAAQSIAQANQEPASIFELG